MKEMSIRAKIITLSAGLLLGILINFFIPKSEVYDKFSFSVVFVMLTIMSVMGITMSLYDIYWKQKVREAVMMLLFSFGMYLGILGFITAPRYPILILPTGILITICIAIAGFTTPKK